MNKNYISMTKTELKTIATAMATLASKPGLDAKSKGNLQIMQNALLVTGKSPTSKVLSYFLENCESLEIDTRYLKKTPSNKGQRSLVDFEIGGESGSHWFPKLDGGRDAVYAARRDYCLGVYQKALAGFGLDETTVPNPIPNNLNKAFEDAIGPYLVVADEIKAELSSAKSESQELRTLIKNQKTKHEKRIEFIKNELFIYYEHRISYLEKQLIEFETALRNCQRLLGEVA